MSGIVQAVGKKVDKPIEYTIRKHANFIFIISFNTISSTSTSMPLKPSSKSLAMKTLIMTLWKQSKLMERQK